MRIAIVGAGVSGIISAKTLQEFGHEVQVFEKCPDLGGVWSSERRYPGLTTQSTKLSYRYSDMPMPRDYPERPSSEQVQKYLLQYAEKHAVLPHVRFNQKVVKMERPSSGQGWYVTTEDQLKKGNNTAVNTTTSLYDHVVVANGTFSEPAIPEFAGIEEYRRAGGVVVHTSECGRVEQSLAGKNVLVIGYGKSACDVANAIADTTASTTVVARSISWKLPYKFLGVLSFKYLLLTRLSESVYEYMDPSPVELFWQGRWGGPFQRGFHRFLAVVFKKQLSLNQLNLAPEGPLVASNVASLYTPGFYEKVQKGEKLFVKRDTHIVKLSSDRGGKPVAVLSSGQEMPADVIICGTGFHQTAPFLPDDVQERLTDEQGNWIGLHRHILPIGIKDLSFNGYNGAMYSGLTSEVTSLWIAAYLEGDLLSLPTEEQQSRDALTRFQWLNQRAPGKTAHGTCTIPFALRPIDDLLQDLQLDISTTSRWLQWVLPFNPSAYQFLGADLRKKLALKRSNQPSSVKR